MIETSQSTSNRRAARMNLCAFCIALCIALCITRDAVAVASPAPTTTFVYALEARKGELVKRGCGDANAAAFMEGFVDRETRISIDAAADLVIMYRRDDTWETTETLIGARPPYFTIWRSGTGAGRWTLILRVDPLRKSETATVTFSAIQYHGDKPCVSQWRGPATLKGFK